MRVNNRCPLVFTVLISLITLTSCGGAPTQNNNAQTEVSSSVTRVNVSTSVNTEFEEMEVSVTAETVDTAPTADIKDTADTTVETEEAPDKYIFRCTDENGAPVSGVMIQVCTDEACIIIKSDDSGNAFYEEKPFEYDIHVFKYPEMYELTSETQFTAAAEYTAYDIRFRSK